MLHEMGSPARRRSFGAIRRLPSERYQASYAGPDLQRHVAPVTFTSAADAETWLSMSAGWSKAKPGAHPQSDSPKPPQRQRHPSPCR